jgi:spore coat polysaccharide biosynthesis predicted glycosyltransferase SpsG
MAQLMVDSDLCIGAAGSTSWERCCLGLPTLMVVLAANQQDAAIALSEVGAAKCISLDKHFATNLKRLVENMDASNMKQLSVQSADICNGHGAEFLATQVMTFGASNK